MKTVHTAIYMPGCKEPRLFSTKQQKELPGRDAIELGSQAKTWLLTPGLYIEVGFLPGYPNPSFLRSSRVSLLWVDENGSIKVSLPRFMAPWLAKELEWSQDVLAEYNSMLENSKKRMKHNRLEVSR